MLKKRQSMKKEIDLIFPSLKALWKVETDFKVIKVRPCRVRPPLVQIDLEGGYWITVSQDSKQSFVTLCFQTPGSEYADLSDELVFRSNQAGLYKELSIGGKVMCKATQLLNKRPSYS
jgi:hypothetical protein